MDANETYGPFILELNNEVSCVADETKEGQESFPVHEETDSDDIPPSVLSYIEISKSRAAACEKLILEELEDEYMESETDLALEYKAERQTRHCEEIKEEQKRQRERDFQEELKKIKEAEKLRQEEVELMWKRAQEKLDHEMLLQQEQFRNLRRQVEEERRMMEEEQKKIRDEEQKRKRDEEDKRKRDEEDKRKRDEEDKRKREEEQKRMRDEEDKRKRDEEDKRKREEEQKRMRDEEDKRKKEEEQKRMRDDEQKRMRDEEDKRKKEEEQKRKRDEEDKRKKEEEQKRMRDEEDKRKKEEEDKRMRDEEYKRKKEEEQKRKKEGDDKRKKEEEDKRKKEEEQKRMRDEEDKRKKEEEQKRMRDEDDKRKKEEEQKRMRDEDDKRKKEEEDKRKKEEEQKRMRDEEEQKRMRDEDDKRKREEEKCMIETGIPQQHDPEENIRQTSVDETVDCRNQGTRPSTGSVSHVDLPEHTEKRRQAWMKDCIPWSKLRSEQNRKKQIECIRSGRGLRVAAGASSLPPLCLESQLQSTDEKSLQEMTTVTLEDLPAYSLSTLAKWTQVRTLTLRRCGLKSLETINQLPQLCFVDVQENDISSVDCENMSNLRVLKLARNNLKSIHGLAGAENLDVLDLSHNSITRIAGLRSLRRLQTLSVDHNHLISTKGLRDVHTLLHLSCSHNHLASVEGLENSALLNTLDLRDNILTEPPNLNNHILLRELHLDENSISSLQGLTSCRLPLMQHLSVARNRITQLPSMANSVSLASLDLQFNCLSELHNVCESLEGCVFLREVHLTGNPLQHDSGWRSILQKAVPVLRAIDDQEADSVQQVSFAPGSFQMFCQAQLQQTHDLQQQHSRELSDAASSLDAVNTSCRHFTEALQLAQDQRFAHECGDTTAAAGLTPPEEILDVDTTNAEKHTEPPEMESTGKVPPVVPNSSWTFEEKSAAESRHDSFDPVATKPKTGSTVSKANASRVDSSATKGKTTSSNLEMTHLSNHQSLDLHNTPAVVTQQLWRKYRQECGIIGSVSTAEKGGGRGGGRGGDGPSYINSVVHQDYAATVIQASWRGFALRRRLASALAAVTCPDIGEEDTFEEVDVDEFVFDEAGLEKHWTFSFSEDSLPRHYHSSEQPLFLKPPGHFPKPSQSILPPPRVYKSKQTRVPGEQRGFAAWRVSPESSNRSTSPDSTSVPCCLSERLEKTMEEWKTSSHTAHLLLKRAKKMKSTMQRQKKCSDPLFRRSSYQHGPVEAPTRPAQHNRNDRNGSRPHFQRAARSRSSSSQSDAGTTVGGAELDLQQAENVERVQQWLHTQAAHPDRDSESVHFLPEISSDILNGGRVQLVDMQADPGYAARRHHVNNSSAAQPCKEPNYPRRNSLGHARNKVPSPQPVTSAPSKKERISRRDDPVQLSGGWGGGKKRGRVSK